MKTSYTQLAIFGGSPVFAEPLHVGRPNIGDRKRLIERINCMLDRRWLTNNGPNVREFEERVAEYVGVKHCIAICNATIALEILIRATELTGEVIVPSFTFVATAHSLQWHQVKPVFCDIDPQTHNIDPARVEELITPRTSGIMGVHVWGRACDVAALTTLANKHRLHLLFDAAHAFGASYQGTMIGNFGDAEVFSFHATKFLNSFEGGAIVTNNDELAKKIRLMKNFGFAGYDTVLSVGTNGKMSEVSAIMGLTGLDSIDELIKKNYYNYNVYCSELSGIPGIKLSEYPKNEKSNFQYIVAEVDETVAGITRDQIVDILHAENVLARRYFYPACHRMEPYVTLDPDAGLHLPETEKLVTRVMSLPSGTAVNLGDMQKIARLIRMCVEQAPEITAQLKAQAALHSNN